MSESIHSPSEKAARLQQAKQDAYDRKMAELRAQAQATPPVPEQPRPRSVTPLGPVAPDRNPVSQPIRRTTRSTPVTQGDVPQTSGISLLQPPQEVQSPRQAVDSEPRETAARPRRRGRKALTYMVLAAALSGGGKVAWDNNMAGINDKVPNINLPTAPRVTAESEYGEIIAPAVTGAEGFNMQNCTAENSEIASLRITTGHYAMRYLLQLGEDAAPRVQPPYVTEDNMGENQKFVTDSGYPEMTIHDVVMSIHACQKDGASAVATTSEGMTIDKNNLDFTATLTIPTSEGLMQTEAYMEDVPEDVPFTYPKDWLPVVDPANTDALKAARDAHFTGAQMQGVFNAAIQTATAGASTASESAFFENVDFIGANNRTLYSAIDEGLKQRVGSKNVTITGIVNAITPQLPNADVKPTLIDTTGNPNDTFKLAEGEVIVGHYKEED